MVDHCLVDVHGDQGSWVVATGYPGAGVGRFGGEQCQMSGGPATAAVSTTEQLAAVCRGARCHVG